MTPKRYLIIAAIFLSFVFWNYRFLFFPVELVKEKSIANISLQKNDASWIQLADFCQTKKCLISLWATWCDPCVRELPELEKRKSQFESHGVELLLVNYDQEAKTQEEVKQWLVEKNITIENYFDKQNKILEHFSLSALPVLIGTSGAELRFLESGEISWQDDKIFTKYLSLLK